MGAMTPPSRKSCYNFRVIEINRVLDGDTIDVTIDLGFDLYKKERVRVAGVDTPEKRTKDLEEKEIVLADEISPDTCRLWDEKTEKKLDKDRFRRDLGDVEGAYQEVLERLNIKS